MIVGVRRPADGDPGLGAHHAPHADRAHARPRLVHVARQRDPARRTPVTIAGDWGPSSVFGGGYRVTVPLAGALLQRVAGISAYSFSAFLMVAIPILTGLAFGAGAYRARRDPLVVLLTMLASAALFLTTPYVGLPRQHHRAVPAVADRGVRGRRAHLVGRARRRLPDRRSPWRSRTPPPPSCSG